MYIDKKLERGYNEYLDLEKDDAGTMMDVGILVMEGGDGYILDEAEKETALSLLEGKVVMRYADQEVFCDRPDMFRHEAWCLLVSAGTQVKLEARSHCEIYLQKTRSDVHFAPVLYRPEDVQVQHAGNDGELMGCMRRDIKTFFDYENAPFSKMVLGEVLNFPGKWSSYPPHHHPQPEVYLHRFDHPQGFGVSFANGEAYTSRHNGLTVVNHGFHSQGAAPGYAMCYLWGIRHLDGDPWEKTRIDDEEHKWLSAEDPNDRIYKG